MSKISYAQRIFAILNLLREQTDENHRMDAKEIVRELELRQGLEIDPRSVRRAIDEMIISGCPIDDAHKYYYRGLFSAGELEYLQKAVQYGSGLVQAQRIELNRKLAQTGVRGGWPNEAYTYRKAGNPELLNTLAVIRNAMQNERQVAFNYGYYDVDGLLKPVMLGADRQKIYNANPYAVVVANGRYYLIATVNRHSELSHYRIDRILGARERRAKLCPAPEKIDAERYIIEHSFMYSGPVSRFRIRVRRKNLNDVFDWFGENIEFENIKEKVTDALVYSDQASMDFWLRRYYKIARLVE